jgi:Rieske Fe-S protein
MKNCKEENICHNRREFLVKSTATASGLVLSLAGLNGIQAQKNDPDDVTLKLDAKSPLSKVGGSLSFDYKGDKIIVVRKSETEFAAFSAFCPHQGGVIFFNEKTNQFVCPLHNSRFSTDGERVSGPARQPLSTFPTQSAIVVSLKL